MDDPVQGRMAFLLHWNGVFGEGLYLFCSFVPL